MHRFKKILCYVGGPGDPQPGLTKATELAVGNGAALMVLDVLPESTEGPWLTVPGKPDLEQLVVSSRLQDLEEMAAPIAALGIEVRTAVDTGSPFVEITRRVLADGHDLVIKTAQGPESRMRGLLGTTALHLMRKCPSPVWVVKPDSGARFGRVLAAVDPDPEKPGAQELSIRVLEHARSVAETSNSKLHVVHAWWLYAEATLTGPRIKMPDAELNVLLNDTRQAAELALAGLLKEVDLGGVAHEIQLVKGIPGEVITLLAAESDLAVMGTVSRSGIAGILIGNTAESVLQRIECSIVAVKPRGFQTPLRF